MTSPEDNIVRAVAEQAAELFLKAKRAAEELRYSASVKRNEGYIVLADQLEVCAVEVDGLGDKVREVIERNSDSIPSVLALLSEVVEESRKRLVRIAGIVAGVERERLKN